MAGFEKKTSLCQRIPGYAWWYLVVYREIAGKQHPSLVCFAKKSQNKCGMWSHLTVTLANFYAQGRKAHLRSVGLWGPSTKLPVFDLPPPMPAQARAGPSEGTWSRRASTGTEEEDPLAVPIPRTLTPVRT